MGQNKPKGFVMVIGAGIAGIQTALSLADAGYGVHLAERSASMGGMIPDLHRIYPLCACCKLDPRIAACEQNPNINILLDTCVDNISGAAGNFSIDLTTGGEKKKIQAGAVIFAAGIETFQPSNLDYYAYGSTPNIVTSVEFEQSQKPLGPNYGMLKRPSDGKTPEKIAWLQCVGSRDINRGDASYCSTVCCMHALKEAVNAKAVNEDIEATIFFIDMRTHGKGYEDYLNAALEKGVKLVRSKVHTINPLPETGDVEMTYADEQGQMQKAVFDMAVLSVGLRPSAQAIELARKVGLRVRADNYLETEPFQPVSTSTEGIFVCGGVCGPHDITHSLIQANAAVAQVAGFLEPESFVPASETAAVPAETQGTAGILLAYQLCAGMSPEIGRLVESAAADLSAVTDVCRLDGDILGGLREKLAQVAADRVVFASCTAPMHKESVEAALRLSGRNPFMYETVDLKLLGSDPTLAPITERLRIGVMRAEFLTPPVIHEIPVVKHALVVGGGVAGMENALALSREGCPVTLVEKEKELGGHGRHVRATWQGLDAQAYLQALIRSVEQDDNITVLTETGVKQNRGYAGNFITTVKNAGGTQEIRHGVTILACGGEDRKVDEYLYGQNDRVYLWSELEDKLVSDPAVVENAGSAVFIQCVGSREKDCPHCSNLCCSFTVRTAVDLKTKNPDMNVFVIYREMRTFGLRENLYLEARKKGVVFIRYDVENKPRVAPSADGKGLTVTVFDPILDRMVSLDADFLSLQTAIRPTRNAALADIFHVNLDGNGFFAPSPEKLKPVDTTAGGVFMAGLAAYPKDTVDTITEARAAAGRALEIIRQDTVRIGGQIAEVTPEKCAVCCTCVRTCPFYVPFIDHERGAAYIDPALCQGCGMCVAECPGKAIVMPSCSDGMLTQVPAALLEGV
ncbi:MAG: heterodisulfide reductase [Deltaproteobacteria bacterium]|nr:MAG: heterodisulfide reductase [Deltaproteobacteria bacterium]